MPQGKNSSLIQSTNYNVKYTFIPKKEQETQSEYESATGIAIKKYRRGQGLSSRAHA